MSRALVLSSFSIHPPERSTVASASAGRHRKEHGGLALAGAFAGVPPP